MKVPLHHSPKQNVIGYGVSQVEVVDLDDLKRVLKEKGITKCMKYSRCIATDDGRCDGSTVNVDALTQDDLDWVTASEPTRSRYLDCQDW